MTTAAWIFLGISWSVIVLVTLYCFVRLLGSKRQFGERDETAD